MSQRTDTELPLPNTKEKNSGLQEIDRRTGQGWGESDDKKDSKGTEMEFFLFIPFKRGN